MITKIFSKNSIFAKMGSVSLSIYMVAMSFAGVATFPAMASAAASVVIDTINGAAPTGVCIAGTVTLVVHGNRGTNGGPYSIEVGDGVSTSSPVSVGSGANGAFTNVSITYTPTVNGTGSLLLNLFHGSDSGNDTHLIVVNQCVAPSTKGVVVIAKHVINNNGGSAVASAFTLGLVGTGTTTPGNEAGSTPGFQVNAGSYTFSDTGPGGYTRTTTSCTDNNVAVATPNDTLTVVAMHNYKCTITNDDNAPTLGGLVVIKNVVNTGGGTKNASDFAISVKSGVTDVTGSPAAGVTGTGRSYTLNAGSYVVSEPANSHYTSAITGTNCTGGNATVSVGATTTCTVTNTYHNAAPTADNQTLNTNEDTPVSGTATGADADGDAFTFGFLSAPTHGTLTSPLNPTTGAFTYTPNLNFHGADSFTFNTTDGVGTSAAATVTINVASVNDNPVAQDDSASMLQDAASTTINVLSNDSDVDGGALSITGVTAPSHGTADTDGSTVTYKPAAGYTGSDSFTYSVSDGNGGTATATVHITVDNVNDAPVAVNDSYSQNEDTQLLITVSGVLLNDTDADGDTLHAILVSNVSHGTLNLDTTTGGFTYDPDANYCGPDSFTYKANDGQVDSNVATAAITVTCVNDAPVAQNRSIDTDQNTATSTNLWATDTEGSALTYDVVAYPTHGFFTSFASSTGAFTYSPNFGFLGADSFTFKANDGALDSNVATVSITVHAVSENTFAKCTDGIDNDGDERVDLNDSDCAPFLPQIVIIKHTIGGDGTFHFVVTDGESTASSTNVTTSEGTGSSAAIVVAPGSYTVSETVPEGWSFNDSSCLYTNSFEEESAAIGIAVPPASEQLSALGAGDVATCTFTNTMNPTNADVSIVKTVDKYNVDAGGTLVYTLTAHNDGPSTATGIVVTDNLPSSVTYVSDTGAGSYSTSTHQWTVGTLATGQSAVLTITVTANQSADHTMFSNEASISANNADTNTDNNTSSVAVTVGHDNNGGGGGGGGNGPIFGGGSNGPIGQVLGASTSLPELPAGCVALLHTFMREGRKANDASEVKLLQQFLNDQQGAGLPVSGVFGPKTDKAVRAFQAAHPDQVLTPWNLSAPTGFVYLTTQRWINLIHCSTLNIPIPTLVPFHE